MNKTTFSAYITATNLILSALSKHYRCLEQYVHVHKRHECALYVFVEHNVWTHTLRLHLLIKHLKGQVCPSSELGNVDNLLSIHNKIKQLKLN